MNDSPNIAPIIFKDYCAKIKPKILPYFDSTNSMDESNFNDFLNLMNWCFIKKNNFFIKDFNKKTIKDICLVYNQMKTNVLSKNGDLFENINIQQLKMLKFILHQYITGYDSMIVDPNTEELCLKIQKQSMKKCLQHFGALIQLKTK